MTTTTDSDQGTGLADLAGRPPPPPVATAVRAEPVRRRQRPWVVVAIVAAATLFVVVAAAAVIHRRAAAAGGVAAGSEVVRVNRGLVERTVESAGRVVSNNDVEIKCRASGAVTKLPFDVHQNVRKGELLCQLDPIDEELALKSAQAELEQSEAKLEQAKQALESGRLNLGTTRERLGAAAASAKVRAANLAAKADRQRELIAQRLGSREEYETAQTDAAAARSDERAAAVAVEEIKQQEIALTSKEQDVRTADAQRRLSQLNADTAQRNLDYATVLAPMDGNVSKLDVSLGTIVQSGTGGFSGGTAILTLTDLSRMFVMATVDQSDFGGVHEGQAARIRVDAHPEREFTGVVVRLPTTGVSASNVVTFEVKVEVTDPDKHLLSPEMTGTVTIVEDRRAGVLHVPAAAVTRQNGKAFVTVAAGGKREVQLGLTGTDSVEVTGGLKEGDTIVLGTEELPTRWKGESRGPG